MNIQSIVKLATKPQLFEKGNSVMWTDPHISKQLLHLHLNPDNDAASRSKSRIEHTVNWILNRANKSRMSILDLGCGPGLYAELFAEKGHNVTGVDFSENSIQYASEQAKEKQLDIKYLNKNYLDLDFVNCFDLVILIYLDFCVLLPDERNKVLENIFRALKNGGIFICDVVNGKNIEKKIIPQSWDAQQSGFWRSSPYIALNIGYHYPEAKAIANHHVVITEDETIGTYIFWTHYYDNNELTKILESEGFRDVKTYQNVLPERDDYWSGENITFYVSKKI